MKYLALSVITASYTQLGGWLCVIGQAYLNVKVVRQLV